MMAQYRVFGDSKSGNCYKIQLLCAILEVEYEWIEVDILAGDTQKTEFLALNANGKIPLLSLPDGRNLSESNAILAYLAAGTELVGGDRFSTADVLRWMFFEQYSHEPNIATSRFIIKYLGNPPDRQAALQEKRVGGYKAFDVMEGQVGDQPFITGDAFTIADISLYAYTHVADEGGFDLDNYPAVRAWIDRIASQPGYIEMRAAPPK